MASSDVHSILEMGLLIGKMTGRCAPHTVSIARNTGSVKSRPAPARPSRMVGFTCRE